MNSRRHQELPANLPPRGLSRSAAAEYIGISTGKFDELVGDGRMPAAIRIDGRVVWDRFAIDRAFDALNPGSQRDCSQRDYWEEAVAE
jgi:predicted DNA-binding transcriptional regulator AlpA